MTLLAIVPAHNEWETVGQVAVSTRPHVDAILLVDDGSTDGTATVAREAGVAVVSHHGNLGKGAAIRTGLDWARAGPEVPTVVMLDADGQHDPAAIPALVSAAANQAADILVGSRFLGTNNAPIYRLFGLHVLSAAAALGSGIRLTDSQSGYRVISPRAVAAMDLRETGFGAESEMQFEAARLGFRMAETPIEIRYAGAARRSPIAHGVGVLLRTIAMTARRRPLRLPLLAATPLLAVAIGATRSRVVRGHAC